MDDEETQKLKEEEAHQGHGHGVHVHIGEAHDEHHHAASEHGSAKEEPAQHLESKLYQNSRQGFVKKVYSILCFQLVITAIFVIFSVKSVSFAMFLITHPVLLIITALVSIICIYALACYSQVSRSVPINYILLLVFTLCESYLV